MGYGWEGERPGDPATSVRARARRGWRWDPPDGCERVAWVLDFVADAAEARGHVAPAELRFAAVVAFLRAAARRRTQRNTARCDAARGNRRGERAERGARAPRDDRWLPPPRCASCNCYNTSRTACRAASAAAPPRRPRPHRRPSHHPCATCGRSSFGTAISSPSNQRASPRGALTPKEIGQSFCLKHACGMALELP